MLSERQEKKYQVETLDPILQIIKEKELQKIRDVHSIHYYGNNEGNDVEKVVVYPDKVEIHVWKNVDGKFTSVEDFKVESEQKGIEWLKSRGFNQANIIKMDYTEYSYEDGVIGLYLIDDFHKSVILTFLPERIPDVEKIFGLENAEVITTPYNKLLDKLGKIRSIEI